MGTEHFDVDVLGNIAAACAHISGSFEAIPAFAESLAKVSTANCLACTDAFGGRPWVPSTAPEITRWAGRRAEANQVSLSEARVAAKDLGQSTARGGIDHLREVDGAVSALMEVLAMFLDPSGMTDRNGVSISIGDTLLVLASVAGTSLWAPGFECIGPCGSSPGFVVVELLGVRVSAPLDSVRKAQP